MGAHPARAQTQVLVYKSALQFAATACATPGCAVPRCARLCHAVCPVSWRQRVPLRLWLRLPAPNCHLFLEADGLLMSYVFLSPSAG